jgi:hypothetical protein
MTTATLVKVRIVFYSLWALCSAWGTAMAGVKWGAMGWEEQSCLASGILLSWTGMMMAFFDKSVWKADEERKASNGGNGQPPKL